MALSCARTSQALGRGDLAVSGNPGYSQHGSGLLPLVAETGVGWAKGAAGCPSWGAGGTGRALTLLPFMGTLSLGLSWMFCPSPAMNIAPSFLSVHSSLHPQKEPWPGHRCGETEARSRLGLPPRSTHGSRSERASWASRTSSAQIPDPRPLPAPSPATPAEPLPLAAALTRAEARGHGGHGAVLPGPCGIPALSRPPLHLKPAEPAQVGRAEGRALRPSQLGPSPGAIPSVSRRPLGSQSGRAKLKSSLNTHSV